MNSLVFFLKVNMKKPVIWIAAAVIFAVTVFSFWAPRMISNLPCAVYSCEKTEETQIIQSYLLERDFIQCESEKDVYDKVKTGLADCGLILNENFTEMLKNDRLEDCARLVTSERSLYVSRYKLMAAVAIYQELMPFKTAKTASEMGYPASAEEILFYEEQIKERVNPLEFRITSVEGSMIQNRENFDLPVGTVSISCFIMIGMICVSLIRKRSENVRQRFDSGLSYFRKCILPQSASIALVLFAAAAAGLLVSSTSRTIPVFPILLALVLYIAVLTILFAFVSMLRISPQILICIIAIDAALSLILCPLYGGTELLGSFIKPLRSISVPYLMYLFLFW